MNRELKFRFFNPLENFMYYSDHFVNLFQFFISANTLKVENIMQSTGCKDSTDKEIYENDIIKTKYKIKRVEFLREQQLIYGDHGTDPHFIIRSGYKFSDLGHDKTIKILGNIYENPELLEAKNE